LNVFAPPGAIVQSVDSKKPSGDGSGGGFPVLVWIHGGSFEYGNSYGSQGGYDATHCAQRGVLVVSINYRLDVFGNLALPELSAEAGGRAGNQWLLDQRAALQWVQREVGAFGGDPSIVTVSFSTPTLSTHASSLDDFPSYFRSLASQPGRSASVLTWSRPDRKASSRLPPSSRGRATQTYSRKVPTTVRQLNHALKTFCCVSHM